MLVGQNDEVSYADRFAAVFKTAGKDVPVTVLPGIDHISLTLDPVAVQAAIAAVESMDHEKSNQTMQPTARLRYNFSVFATTPCRGLSLSPLDGIHNILRGGFCVIYAVRLSKSTHGSGNRSI